MRNLALILAALAFLTGCGSGDGESGSGEVVIDLKEQNGSGESGTATLTTDGEKTKVVIALDNPSAVPQPAHIHEGSCAELDPNPAYGLENVVSGMSTTMVDRPLEELRDADYAIKCTSPPRSSTSTSRAATSGLAPRAEATAGAIRH